MCPWAGRMFPTLFPAEIVCHCLLIETNNGLLLVDTGLGLLDLKNPGRLGATSRLLGVSNDCSEAAVNQIIRLGFSPSDVRHIIPTHLDLDHAGGIVDFPHAVVHTLSLEYQIGRAHV